MTRDRDSEVEEVLGLADTGLDGLAIVDGLVMQYVLGEESEPGALAHIVEDEALALRCLSYLRAHGVPEYDDVHAFLAAQAPA